ncbi:MAG: leucine-rich repeat protein [Alistipes sp.]|nr:leucine-rich repeat protein [Alistipes sp.]
MKKLFTYLLSAVMILAVGCSEGFDDSEIWDKLNSLENRVAALEQLCKEMNTNISSLSDIVKSLQNNDYVTNIAPITEDGKVIGYTITFSKSGSVTIYHGKDGKDGADGYTPVIGVAKDTDGIYYWTLDGDWLLDKDGNKVKAEGKDGLNGKDGITPKLKIENGYWLISYDNGSTWQELGKATGEDGKDGDSMFKEVTYDDDFVYITLTDGSVLTIPRRKIAANEIWYTSTDSRVVKPYKTDAFGANILSNVYENGQGVITFDGAVTSIGYAAFEDCSSLTSVTIPDSVTIIGVNAFWGCKRLTSITIPDSVTKIGVYAFANCSSLTSITIPDNFTTIESCVFASCSSLTSITIPDSVTEIGESAFNGCSSLTSITIGDSVTEIGVSAFSYCSSLTSVTIGNSVTKIRDYAFYGCSSLTSITIPDSVTTIGALAFYNCSSLTSITIPDSVTSIGEDAFFGCSSLEKFYGKFASADNRCLIIDGVLNSFAPAGLTSYTIPNSVTTIVDSAFSGCSSLRSIIIPDSVTTIGEWAFHKCSSLTSITIPNSVTTIGNYAFLRCYSLTSVYCQPTTPPTGGGEMFNGNAPGRKIYVPTASVDAYIAADGWKDYADDIVGYDF